MLAVYLEIGACQHQGQRACALKMVHVQSVLLQNPKACLTFEWTASEMMVISP